MVWCERLYDMVRIDHFRAFHSYWSVPAGGSVSFRNWTKVGVSWVLV